MPGLEIALKKMAGSLVDNGIFLTLSNELQYSGIFQRGELSANRELCHNQRAKTIINRAKKINIEDKNNNIKSKLFYRGHCKSGMF